MFQRIGNMQEGRDRGIAPNSCIWGYASMAQIKNTTANAVNILSEQ